MTVGYRTPDELRRAGDELERATQQLVEAVESGSGYAVHHVLGRVDAALAGWRTAKAGDPPSMTFAALTEQDIVTPEVLADLETVDDIVLEHLQRRTAERLEAHQREHVPVFDVPLLPDPPTALADTLADIKAGR